MFKIKLPPFLLQLAVVSLIPYAALAQTVLLDTFDNGTVGLAPTLPEIGFSSATPFGAHTLVNPDANGDLRARCLDAAADNGCRSEPTSPRSTE